MFPHLKEVNNALLLIDQGKSGDIKQFPLKCCELNIILQRIRHQEHREITLQLLKSQLIDKNYEEALSFLSFVNEKQYLLKLLQTTDTEQK
ncbi:Conserved_hypothetical protein [Hexamita inflata]|uniref:Uncharacterized protein n=1 Tax=Hexamita inflata TaxID=28002 RepID=A0AA86TGZ9_9EUKA|nr:Conserved hypothetical protein [Hexamita inflata]